MTKPLLIVLATRDFDPSEVAAPWRAARAAGLEIAFATEDGEVAACDPLVLAGPLFGMLGANKENCATYAELAEDPAFLQPLSWSNLNSEDFGGLLLPGGHAKGMRQYLESGSLRTLVLQFFDKAQPVGAICHGPIVLARTLNADGQSVIAGRKATALTRSLENTAWLLTAWKLGDYYRTYPTWVETEMRGAIGENGSFERGPLMASYGNPFTVRDGNLLTARWPGDASRFADELVAMVQAQ
ncbi:MAG: DJ-1/PfpI family protein [Myxococcales bacterium]|nr:DJ-1/PfpI family protein [Myxococcales bacterium]